MERGMPVSGERSLDTLLSDVRRYEKDAKKEVLPGSDPVAQQDRQAKMLWVMRDMIAHMKLYERKIEELQRRMPR